MSAMADYEIWLDEHGLTDSEESRTAYLAEDARTDERRVIADLDAR